MEIDIRKGAFTSTKAEGTEDVEWDFVVSVRYEDICNTQRRLPHQ
jgi:hypothetical protein